MYWADDGQEYSIYWLKIDASGVPAPVQEISDPSGRHFDMLPEIVLDSSGNSYVVWQSVAGSSIYWVKVNPSGICGTVQEISTHPDNTNGHNHDPKIAVDSGGNSYVVWYGSDGNDYEIYWVKIDSSGVPGTVQKISNPDNPDGKDQFPQIAVDSLGNSYVTWEGYNNNMYEIYWMKIDSSGARGIIQKVSIHPDNAWTKYTGPQIAVDPSGNSYIAWDSYSLGRFEIYWAKINAAGIVETVKIVSNHPEDDLFHEDMFPQIAVDSGGNSYIVWESYDWNQDIYGIYWTKVDPSGVPDRAQEVTAHPGNPQGPAGRCRIAVDYSRNLHIVWNDYDGNDYEIYFALIFGEPAPSDTDSDGLSDSEESAGWTVSVYDCTGDLINSYHVTSDPYIADTDGDGLTDLEEKEGWDIGYWLESDESPEGTWIEYHVTSNPQNADSDFDGLSDWQENMYRTDPYRPDTDCDGAWGTTDKFEVDNGLNPTDFDSDGDGLEDGEEIDLWIKAQGYSPDDLNIPQEVIDAAVANTKNPDVDNDGMTDGEEISYWVDLGLTPQEAIALIGEPDMNRNGIPDSAENLPNIITRCSLHKGIETSLLSKVENAVKSLEKGDLNAALNQLKAFINEVEAQRGKKIPEDIADMLIMYVKSIILQIQTA